MKHTPGKWEVDGTSVYGLQDCSWQGKPDKKNRFFLKVYSGGRDTASEEELEANARLIASAPELLEACKEVDLYFKGLIMLGQISPEFEKSELYNKIQQAIAKAEGKE